MHAHKSLYNCWACWGMEYILSMLYTQWLGGGRLQSYHIILVWKLLGILYGIKWKLGVLATPLPRARELFTLQ